MTLEAVDFATGWTTVIVFWRLLELELNVTDTYILGLAMHPPSAWVADKRLEEMVFDTAKAALEDARIARAELDHITIAACDELDGRSISSMLLSAPAGAYLKDEIKTTDSGLIGLCLEAMRIESGRFHLGLLSSWNKSSKAPFEDVMRMRCEPFYTRDIGLNMSIADGLFAQAVSGAYGISESDVNGAIQASYEQADKNERGMRATVPSLAEIEDIAVCVCSAAQDSNKRRSPMAASPWSSVPGVAERASRSPSAGPAVGIGVANR